MVDAFRIGVRSADGRWGASVFAKNLLDERFRLWCSIPGSYDQAFSPNAFRTIGISLEGRF